MTRQEIEQRRLAFDLEIHNLWERVREYRFALEQAGWCRTALIFQYVEGGLLGAEGHLCNNIVNRDRLDADSAYQHRKETTPC